MTSPPPKGEKTTPKTKKSTRFELVPYVNISGSLPYRECQSFCEPTRSINGGEIISVFVVIISTLGKVPRFLIALSLLSRPAAGQSTSLAIQFNCVHPFMHFARCNFVGRVLIVHAMEIGGN